MTVKQKRRIEKQQRCDTTSHSAKPHDRNAPSESISYKTKNKIESNISRKDRSPYLQPFQRRKSIIGHIYRHKKREGKLRGRIDHTDDSTDQQLCMITGNRNAFGKFLHPESL